MEPLDVLGQRVVYQSGPAVRLAGVDVLIAVFLGEVLSVLDDVSALVAVLGEGHILLALIDLQVPGLQRGAELVHLVAGIIDIKLPFHLVASGVQHGGQSVTQHAATGVADVHGAGGVGGDELHQHPFALAEIGAAVLAAQLVNILQDLPVEPVVIGEVQKAGTGDLALSEIGAFQVQVLLDGLSDLLGRHAEAAGSGHGGVAGPVPVGPVRRDLQSDLRQGSLRQLTLFHSQLHSGPQCLTQLVRGGGD